MYGDDILIILGIVTIIFSWLDIFSISLFIRKIILGILMIGALYVGCISFPNSADFEVYKILYFSGASDQFDFPYIEDGIIDYGFLWLWILVKSFGGDIHDAYFVTCVIALFCYYVSISKYTSYILTVWSFIYIRIFCVSNIIQIRQGLAMAIILLGLQYIEKRCFWKFLITVILAALIHKTVVVVILLYPLTFINWNESKFFIGVVLFTFLSVIGISEMFFLLASIIGIGVEKIYSYAGTVYFSELSIEALLMQGIPILLCAYYLICKKERYTNLFVSMLLCGYFFLMLSKELVIMSRMTSTFLLCMNFIPVYLFCDCKKISHKIIIMLLINLVLIVLFLKNIVLASG